MGTKACIARAVGMGWEGTYVHSDGGPGCTGRAIVEMVKQRGAEATLQYAEQAPQGWTHFPDAPSVYHDEPFIITPTADGGVEWLYLIDSDHRIQVYVGSPWGDRDGRRFERVNIIDPQAPGALGDMAALSNRQTEPDRPVHAPVDPLDRPHAIRLTPPPGGLRMTPESLVSMLQAMDGGDDETVEPNEAEADALLIGMESVGTTIDQLLDEAARTVETALRPGQTAEARYEALTDLAQIIEAVRCERAAEDHG